MGAQHMPGEEVWFVGEHRSSSEQKYYLSNLPADTPIRTLASAIKARWVCEQAHQQLKEELGLDHRSWTGLHRHVLMTMIAYAFFQSRRLQAAGREKKSPVRRRCLASSPSGKRSSPASNPRLQHAVRTAAMSYAQHPASMSQSSANIGEPQVWKNPEGVLRCRCHSIASAAFWRQTWARGSECWNAALSA